jgi:eukaryotic-like serine/threonine-protein kinase
MTTPSHEEALFQAAAQLAGTERVAFLERECAGDRSLRARLEALLAAHEQSDGALAGHDEANRPTITLDLSELPDTAVGQTIGRYKLLERIGEGGCGVVYVAEQTEPVRRRVALKVIKLGMDTKQVVARFEAERQALALMDHPNIAKVLDAGTTKTDSGSRGRQSAQTSPDESQRRLTSAATIGGGRPYFVMELVRGIRITDYCEQNKLSIKERLDLFIKVCQAIQHAHQKGIIHRDIKPSNILVTLHDGVPVPKVIDFGIAKATQGKLTDATVYTQLHQFIGTPAYMSPEQAEMSGLDIDTRSDIYSLGVLLYELLTGTTPFDAKVLLASGIDAMRKTIREQEPVRPSTRLTQIQPATSSPIANRKSKIENDLDWIVMKCLEKDRTRRYETANGLAADLKRHLTHEPIVARPPSAIYRLGRSWRRNRLAYSAGTVVAVALVAGMWISAWMARTAITARVAEAAARLEAEQARNVADREKEIALSNLREARRTAYLADMRIVQESIRGNNMSRARRLQNEHRALPGEEDYRDWEWFHFERLAWVDHGEIIGSHPGGARHLLTSAHNTFVTAGSTLNYTDSSGQIQVWDGTRRRMVTGFATPEAAEGIALSQDGQRLAIARGLEIEIRHLAAPATAITLLTNWHSDTHYEKNHRHGLRGGLSHCGINIMRFIDDDKRLAVTRRSYSNEPEFPHPLTFIDIDEDSSTPAVTGNPINDVLSTALSTNGELLAVSVGGKDVVILRLPGRQMVSRFAIQSDRAPLHALSPLAFVNQDRHLATVSETGRIDLWDVSTGLQIRTVGEHGASVAGLAVSPDGNRLASAGMDHLIQVWHLGDIGSAPQVLRGHEDEIWGVAFLADGQTLVSCGQDQSVRCWDLRQPPSREEAWPLPPGNIFATLRFSTLAAVGRALRWTTWDISHIPRTLEPRLVPPHLSAPGATVIPVPGTEYQLVIPEPIEPELGSGLGVLLYRGPDDSEPVAHFPGIRILRPEAIDYSQGTLCLHGLLHGMPQLLVWSVAEEKVAHLIPTTTTNASAIAFAPNNSLVFLGNPGGGLEGVDLVSGRAELWTGALPGTVTALAVLPDNRTVLAASRTGVLRKIDWPDRRLLREEVPGQMAAISTMSISPTGSRFATGDEQGTVRLWDAESLREVVLLGTHPGRVGGVHFQPDGTLLSVDSRELRIWRGG